MDLPVRSPNLPLLTDEDLSLLEKERDPERRVQVFAVGSSPEALSVILEHDEHRSVVDERADGFTALYRVFLLANDPDRLRRAEVLLDAGANPDSEQYNLPYWLDTPLRAAVRGNDRAFFDVILRSDQVTKDRLLELHAEAVADEPARDPYEAAIRTMVDLIEQNLIARKIEVPQRKGRHHST